MIYTSAIYADAAHTTVTGTDAEGETETVAVNHTLFRQPNDGPVGFVANGGVIGAYVPPPVTLPDLAPYQFRAMLTLSGNQDALNAFIAALPEPNKTIAQSKMEYSLTFRRNNDLVMAAQGALGLTEQELDVLWLQASLIL